MEYRELYNGPIKLRHLVLIATIADQGSIVRAANNLYVTQPVVTRALRELEDILGVPLFDRGPRGVTPTVFGEAFLKDARAAIAHLHLAERHVAEMSDATVGSVTVGTHAAGANILLPQAIARLKADRPRVKVVVKEATWDRLVEGLVSGDVDLMVGRLSALGGPNEQDLEQTELYREPIRIVARDGHPALELEKPTLAELRDFAWILPAAQTALHRELEEAFSRQGAAPPAGQIECSGPLTVRALLLEGDFLAAMPQSLADREPGLRILGTELEGVGSSVGITSHSHYSPSPSARLMVEHLKAVARDINGSAMPAAASGRDK